MTRTVTNVEIGTVLTDADGNGSLDVAIGPIAKGTYTFQVFARNGAGCGVAGGGGNTDATCNAVFQAPGPFGSMRTISVP